MGLVRYSNVHLDSCPKCHGIWLDGDEIAGVLGPAFSDATAAKTDTDTAKRSKKVVYSYSSVFVSAFMSAFYRNVGQAPTLMVVAVGGVCHFLIEKYGNDRSKRFNFPISILVALLFLEASAPLVLSEPFMGWIGLLTVVVVPAALLICVVSGSWKKAAIALIGYETLLLALSTYLMVSASSPEEISVGLFHATLNGAIVLGFLHGFPGVRRPVGDGLLVAAFVAAIAGATAAKVTLFGGAIVLVLASHLFHPLGEQLQRIGLLPNRKPVRGRRTSQ